MSQEFGTPSPPPPAPSLPWNEVWISALTQPSVATFEGFLRDPNATSRRAYIWTLVNALIGYAISFVLSALLGGVFGTGTLEGPGAAGAMGSLLTALICGAPIVALLSVLMLMISAGITQLIARALGGTGTYSELVYAFAAFAAPLTLITSVLSPIPFINLLNIPLGIYGIVLNVIAVKAVNKFGWGQAIASSVLILIAILVLVACVVIGILLLLGPVIGNVFSNIVENI